MGTIKISIIATFYNLEDYVKKCIDSLTQQTLKDIEIICVNDGSTDNTIKILQELAEQDNRIKIIDKKNEGVSIARNTGIQAASGDYIMFVDGDDYLELNACEILYQKAIETNVDIVTFQFTYKWTNKSVKDKKFKNSPYYYETKSYPYLFSDKLKEIYKSINPGICWDKLYDKNFIISNKIFFPKELTHNEDTVFILKVLLHNPKIFITNYYLYNHWKSNTNSLTHIDKYSYLLKILKAIDYANTIFDDCKYNKNNIIYLYFIDDTFRHLLTLCSCLYFTRHKKDYISSILKILDKYKIFDKTTVGEMDGYKRGKRYLQMDKYHLLEVYLSIIRPIGKYLIVKPYRFIKTNLKK